MTDELTLKKDVSIALQNATKTEVLSNEDYDAAGNARKEIKYTLKQIANYWAPKKDQAYQLHKSLVAAEKEMTDPLNRADKIIDQRMGDYRRKVEIARQEAERERQRQEAETRRLEAEAAAKAAEVQRLADEAAQKEELDDEDVQILQMAQAEAVKAEQSVVIMPDVYVPPAAKVEGISVRKIWKARIVDDSLVPVSVVGVMLRPVDMSALNKLAVASKGGFNCPGVEFYQEESTQVRL